GHEHFGKRTALAGDARKARELSGDGGALVVMQLGARFRRVLLLTAMRKAVGEIAHQFGKFLEFAATPPLGFAGEARHAGRPVSLKADALLLAVIADIDAGVLLFIHHMADCLFHLRFELRSVVALAGFAPDQKIAQGLAARQAADMGGQDSVAAEHHGRAPKIILQIRRWVILKHDLFRKPVPTFRDYALTDCGALHHRHNGCKEGQLGRNCRAKKRMQRPMNRVQSSAAPRNELPSTATAPRDYNFAADILKRNLDAGRSDKIAFIDHRGKYSYGDLADRVERFGHVLRGLGMRSEERILICLLDSIDWPIAFLGAIKAGVVAVPVNTLMTEDDYRFMLEDSRARVLVVSEELLPKFAPAIAASKSLEHVIVSGAATHGHHHFAELLAGADNKSVTAPTTCDDMCFWLYTSGSTGKPKGAVHTHADLKLTDELYARPILDITENDICYSVAKLFFAYGLGNALTFPMSAGATTVLLPARPTPDLVADLL